MTSSSLLSRSMTLTMKSLAISKFCRPMLSELSSTKRMSMGPHVHSVGGGAVSLGALPGPLRGGAGGPEGRGGHRGPPCPRVCGERTGRAGPAGSREQGRGPLTTAGWGRGERRLQGAETEASSPPQPRPQDFPPGGGARAPPPRPAQRWDVLGLRTLLKEALTAHLHDNVQNLAFLGGRGTQRREALQVPTPGTTAGGGWGSRLCPRGPAFGTRALDVVPNTWLHGHRLSPCVIACRCHGHHLSPMVITCPPPQGHDVLLVTVAAPHPHRILGQSGRPPQTFTDTPLTSGPGGPTCPGGPC